MIQRAGFPRSGMTVLASVKTSTGTRMRGAAGRGIGPWQWRQPRAARLRASRMPGTLGVMIQQLRVDETILTRNGRGVMLKDGWDSPRILRPSEHILGNGAQGLLWFWLVSSGSTEGPEDSRLTDDSEAKTSRPGHFRYLVHMSSRLIRPLNGAAQDQCKLAERLIGPANSCLNKVLTYPWVLVHVPGARAAQLAQMAPGAIRVGGTYTVLYVLHLVAHPCSCPRVHPLRQAAPRT
jgi:hypothetical protein